MFYGRLTTSVKKGRVIIFLKKCIAKTLLTMMVLGTAIGATEAYASTTSSQYAKSEWNQYKLDSNVINKNGNLYLPLRSVFSNLDAELKWKPEGKNIVEVYTEEKAFNLYLKEEGGKTYLSNKQSSKGEALLVVNGSAYLPVSSLQNLVNRTVTVTGNQLTMIDYQPTWQGSVNTNNLWKDNLVNVNKPVVRPQAVVRPAQATVQPQTYSAAQVTPPPQLAAVVQAAPTPQAAAKKDVAPAAVPVSANIEDLLVTAKGYMGVPYVWGGNTPEQGFDCSGFTRYVFQKYGVNLPRVAADQQKFAKPIALSELQPGDLVFWGAEAYHVGIYLGDGKYVHAAWSGQVEIGQYDWFPYTGAGRVM